MQHTNIRSVKGGEGRRCHFLKPLKLTQELSQNLSYSCELWYGSCFYDVYSGTAKKRRRNRRYRQMPPKLFCHFSPNYLNIYKSFETNLSFSKKSPLVLLFNLITKYFKYIIFFFENPVSNETKVIFL